MMGRWTGADSTQSPFVNARHIRTSQPAIRMDFKRPLSQRRVQFITGWECRLYPDSWANRPMSVWHPATSPAQRSTSQQLWDNASPTAFQTGLMTDWIYNVMSQDCSILSFLVVKKVCLLCVFFFVFFSPEEHIHTYISHTLMKPFTSSGCKSCFKGHNQSNLYPEIITPQPYFNYICRLNLSWCFIQAPCLLRWHQSSH